MAHSGNGADGVVVRPVIDEDELRAVFAFVAPLFAAEVGAAEDFRLDRLLGRFTSDHDLMLVATEADGTKLGAALAYRNGPSGVTLQAIAVAPTMRRRGLASCLLAEVEQVALRSGRMSIVAGIEPSARPFYEAHGYSGRRTVFRKSLAGRTLAESSSSRQERLAALRSARSQRQAHPSGGSEPDIRA